MENAVTEADAGCDKFVRKKVICRDSNIFEVKTARPGDEVYITFEGEVAGVELSVVRLQL